MRKVTGPRVVAKQHLADLELPSHVTLSLVELARSAKEHLLSFSVALGIAEGARRDFASRYSADRSYDRLVDVYKSVGAT